jgi:hypothetical protein
MINERNDKRVKAGWENSLIHQIPGGEVKSYEEIKIYLLNLLNTIFRE